ncbi:MAG: tRNA (adenosine(37)-N6)-threonylcarbamoyltransferase complex ATPase subunit type 1 TsaE [Bacteroidota bacterium]
MPEQHFEVSGIDDLQRPAEALQTLLDHHHLFAFHGPMGVGKTTLIKVFCTLVGVKDEMSSPTFSLVNEYRGTGDHETIFHFDFYRIERDEEVFDLGYEEYMYSGHVCLMEWPEKIAHLLPEDHVNIHMREEQGKRLVTIAY